MNISLSFIKSFKNNIIPKFNIIIRNAFSEKYLLYTNLTISVGLSGVGDVLEQNYEILTNEIQEWNKTRTKNMAISGFTVGIVVHYWYKVLERSIPGYSLGIVCKKVLVDQFIGSPLCIGTFFVTCGYLEGSTVNEFLKEVKQKAWRLYAAEWMIWPPAQFVNFYILPHQYRVLFDNTISLGYDIYTSKVKHHNE